MGRLREKVQQRRARAGRKEARRAPQDRAEAHIQTDGGYGQMETLTRRDGIGAYALKECFGCDPGQENEKCGLCPYTDEATQRLGEYEATGLSPKEVLALKKKLGLTWVEGFEE